MRRRVAVAGLLVALVVVVFRPTPAQLADTLPHGPGDAAFITWTMAWGAHAIPTEPTGYFDSNIYWPHRDTTVYADTLLPLVPVYAVLHGITGSWMVTLNLIVLGLVVLNLAATYALARWSGVSRPPALLAAIAFGFCGYVLAHYGHVNLQALGLLPLAFLVLFRLLEAPRAWSGVALGALSAAIALTAAYYGLIWGVSVVAVVSVFALLQRDRVGAGLVRALGVAAAVAVALCLPVVVAYVDVQENPQFRHGLEPEAGINAEDVLSTAPGSYLYRDLDRGITDDVEHRFFPGLVTLALAPVGLVALVRMGAGAAAGDAPVSGIDHRRLCVILLVCAGAVALVLAVGDTFLGRPTPFRFLKEHAPGFKSVRIPARFAVVTLLAGAVVAAWGLELLLRRIGGRTARLALAVVVPAVLLVELLAPLRHFPFDDRDTTLAVYRELARREPGVVVELPMADPDQPGGAYIEAPRDLYSTIDWNDRVNGYSAYRPPGYDETVDALVTLPARRGWRLLERLDVRYVLVHVGYRNGGNVLDRGDAAELLLAMPPGARATRHGASWLVEVDVPDRWLEGLP